MRNGAMQSHRVSPSFATWNFVTVVRGVGICIFGGGVDGLGVGISGGLGEISCGGGGPSIATIDLEKLPEQSQSEKNKAEESDNSSSPMGREIISKFQHDSVKTISIDKFLVRMPMNIPNAVFGNLVLKCQLRKSFDELRSIMKNENIDGVFKKSCFVYFLEMFKDHTLHFRMSIVYGLLKCRIKYVGNKGKKKMDEVWINYCGMPVCFGLKEFSIVMGLRCDHLHLEEPLIKLTPYKGSDKCKVVYPWIVPTIDELGMTSFLTPSLVDTKEDPTVELIKKKLAGVTSIRREVRKVKAATPPALRVVEVQGPLKKVDIFMMLGKEKKKELIMDLNFYNNFKDRYADLHKLANSGGPGFDKIVFTFQWDKKAIKYFRGKRPYLHDKSWTKAKRILTVMNVEVKYFLAVEILIYEGKIKVYNCNLPIFNEDKFLAHMQPLLKLLPDLLT
ncbi:hypothetical protein FXO38_20142 [Capsicum annuum]|nr:hypothetical protein FXO38_20142 [Capsicum annuum]KAF3683946.1 hypothetical protein FXO37_01603 [Capsicum annuum]